MSDYADLIARKLAHVPPSGIASGFSIPASLFDHQAALTAWALRRGRAAIFADTGLGKSRMQLSWADAVRLHTGRPVLILAPLAVAQQTAAEGAELGLQVTVCRDGSDVGTGLNITNYDRMHRFDPSIFGGVVLDESSIIKHHDARTFSTLTSAFRGTPFRLCATATPAPNDWTELGTHAEFLGICTRQEMLAEFFTHDGGDTSVWRLKGHARHVFWRWVCSWGALIRRPSDLGFDDGRYALPPLHLHEHTVSTEMPTNGMLFASEAQTLSERRDARRLSMNDRIADCVATVNGERYKSGAGQVQGRPGSAVCGDSLPEEAWLIWCDLNDEQDALERAFGDRAFSVRGPMSPDDKEAAIRGWLAGDRPIMIAKPSIMGWGINAQHCARMAFVGVTDSFEAYYQAVRRSWRFGQSRDVHVHIFASDAEGAVVANLKRKERDAVAMAESLSAETRDAVMAEVTGSTRETNTHNAAHRVKVPAFLKESA